jgi:hypothetical protein
VILAVGQKGGDPEGLQLARIPQGFQGISDVTLDAERLHHAQFGPPVLATTHVRKVYPRSLGNDGQPPRLASCRTDPEHQNPFSDNFV